ncbi:MAG TPA: DUF1016 N-terminal domain-containing protein [Polyangiaceae bacterium]
MSRSGDIRSRFALGEAIAEIKRAPSTYGERAVARLAAELGEDLPSLYRYATVAERWSAAQLEELLGRTGADGRTLSWSHLVLLAGVESPCERDRYADRALAESLSVRELASAIEACVEGSPGRGVLARNVRAAEKFLAARIDGTALGGSGLHASREGRRLLEQAIAAHEAMKDVVQRQLDELRSLRDAG